MLYNRERLLALMDRFNLDGVVAATPENILYLSGFSSWSQNAYRYGGSQVYLVFPRDQSRSPALLISGGDVGYAALGDVWLKEVYTYGRARKHHVPEPEKLSAEEKGVLSILDLTPKGQKAEEALAQLIKEKTLDGSNLGIDQFGIPVTSFEMLNALLPKAQLRPASSFFRYVRMIKTPPEIERLREAATVNENAIKTMLSRAQPGATEGELAAIYRGQVARAGGQVYWMHMSVSRGGNFPAITDRVLENGDIFRVDMGCSVRGYHADTCKSGCLGEPTEAHRKKYQAVRTGVLNAVEKLKPGVLPAELYETMLEGVRSAGIPKYSNFFVGHTIGLEAREFPFLFGAAEEIKDPFLPRSTNIPMEPGMVVNLEASSHELGWGSVQVEYTLVVTEDGREHLIPPEQRLYSLPLS
ncbi:MAG: aminopeptidase P family protein [Deltaproteobacteria bacterium]|nr:aminopeptidase P family protein [Deltaproteobacteria bacterium]